MLEQPHIELGREDRFDRFRRISWWDQQKLAAARILVIGAGALGNETLKNLALLGVGNLFVADLDCIEESNLSRSILYRERDSGRPKAQVAAGAVRDIYPEVKVHWFRGDVVHELGMGVYDWADLVIAGVDNREARLHINRCCWKTNTPWIDGATEVLRGVVRVFVPPEGPCYECTMTEADWKLLKEQRGCAGLRAEDRQEGRVPTTPTTASIISALQCQEALKLLHGREALAGKGLVYDGLTNETYIVSYNSSDDCLSHDAYEQIVRLNRSVQEATLREIYREAETRLGKGAVLEFGRDLLLWFRCPTCGLSEEVFRPRGAVPESAARCSQCGQDRQIQSVESAYGAEEFLDRTLVGIGVPPYDVVVGRKGFSRVALELAGDAPSVLGPLFHPLTLESGGNS